LENLFKSEQHSRRQHAAPYETACLRPAAFRHCRIHQYLLIITGIDEFDDVDMLLYANLIRDLSHALLPRQINHGMGLRRLCVAALSLLAALPHCASNSGAPAANPQQFSLLPTILRISEAAGGAQTTQATRHGHMPHPCQGLGLKLGGYSAWDLSVLSILYYSYTIDEL
jgi:hypothetical protein